LKARTVEGETFTIIGKIIKITKIEEDDTYQIFVEDQEEPITLSQTWIDLYIPKIGEYLIKNKVNYLVISAELFSYIEASNPKVNVPPK